MLRLLIIPARVFTLAVGVLCVLTLLGCAGSGPSPADRTAAISAATPAPVVARRVIPTPRRHRVHHRRPVATSAPAPSALHACDPNIKIRASTTTCPFAENVFYAFYTEGVSLKAQNAVHAYSAATARDYAVACATDGAENVTCVAGDGGEVHFNLTAIRAYDDRQAARYAGSHDLGPNQGVDPSQVEGSAGGGTPAQPSDPAPTDSGPTPANEIPNYDEGNGYPVQCADGKWSQSGGIQGACSGHGGEG
jgi:hypothetical protein